MLRKLRENNYRLFTLSFNLRYACPTSMYMCEDGSCWSNPGDCMEIKNSTVKYTNETCPSGNVHNLFVFFYFKLLMKNQNHNFCGKQA